MFPGGEVGACWLFASTVEYTLTTTFYYDGEFNTQFATHLMRNPVDAIIVCAIKRT